MGVGTRVLITKWLVIHLILVIVAKKSLEHVFEISFLLISITTRLLHNSTMLVDIR